MKQLFDYLDRVPRSRNRVLIIVLLISMVIALGTYMLFLSGKLGDRLLLLAAIAIAFYTVWISVLYALQRQDHIRLSDLGLSARDAMKGIWAGFYIFLAVNLIFMAVSLITTQQVAIAENFRTLQQAGRVVGTFIFSILAGAFIEEAIYRAYLIPQFYLRLKGRISNHYTSLAIAVLVSQLLFGLSHLPRQVFTDGSTYGLASYNFLQLFIGGVIHAVVYLRTRNLIFVTLVHAFINFSLTVIETSSSFRLFSLLITVIIALSWSVLFPDRRPLTIKRIPLG